MWYSMVFGIRRAKIMLSGSSKGGRVCMVHLNILDTKHKKSSQKVSCESDDIVNQTDLRCFEHRGLVSSPHRPTVPRPRPTTTSLAVWKPKHWNLLTHLCPTDVRYVLILPILNGDPCRPCAWARGHVRVLAARI